jgi:peroxisomal membrane protein 2
MVLYLLSDKKMIPFLAYLASLAVIGGAKSWSDVKKTVRGGFFPVIRVNLRCSFFILAGMLKSSLAQVIWVSSPLSLVFAQRFLSPEVCSNLRIDYHC